MKDVFTIHQADNGIMLKSDEYVEVVENSHEPDGKGKDNLYLNLGRYLYSMIECAMNRDISNNVQVELNITKIEQYDMRKEKRGCP